MINKFLRSGVGMSVLVLPLAAWAQTASEITPSTLAPELRDLNGTIVFTGQAGTEAPPGSEDIGITLTGVEVEGGLPDLSLAENVLVTRLTRGRIPVSELFDATSELEAAYANEGFVLSRVILPQQELRDGGVLRVVVVNGFIERVDTDAVPEETRRRIGRLTESLVDRPGLTQAQIERQLLLVGDTPGTSMRSALGAGEQEGGAVIALDPEFKPVTGFIGIGNPTGSALGDVSLNLGVEVNSPLKLGETFYARASGAPNGFFSSEPRSRVLALGVLMPIGFNGLTLNVEATQSDTTPSAEVFPTRSEFSRQSIRLNYPFVRTRSRTIGGLLALDFQEDSQDLIVATGDISLFEDQVTVLRFGGDLALFHDNDSVTNANLIWSQGLDVFGARSAADAAATNVPLSRFGADADFSKIAGFISHRRNLSEQLSLSVIGRFQSSFGDALITSEQFTLVGASELSTFDSGSLRGDNGWLVRTEVSTQRQFESGLGTVSLSPYAFLGYGEASLEQPTVLDQRRVEALAYGVGVDVFVQSDSSFRSNTVRVEFGKGEQNGDDEDDTRLSISANIRF